MAGCAGSRLRITAAVSAFALPIDHYATMLAIIGALIGCAYIATRRAPSRVDSSYRKQLNRCIVLCGASATALSCVSPPKWFSPASGCRERSGGLQLRFLCCRYWLKSRRSSGSCFRFAQQSDARRSRPRCYEIRQSPIPARCSPAGCVSVWVRLVFFGKVAGQAARKRKRELAAIRQVQLP